MRIKKFGLILIAIILLSSLTLMSLVNAQYKPTSLTITVPSGPHLKTCTIEATLKDENGNPLPNMYVDFFYAHMDGSWCVHWFDTVKTDSNGVASIPHPFPTAIETFRFHARFNRTTNYAPSTSEYIYIAFVFKDYTSYIIVGGLIAVAIVGVVGYIVFRRRKKR